jgi:hypothetical protein
MQKKHLIKMLADVDDETFIKIAIFDDGKLDRASEAPLAATSAHCLNILKDDSGDDSDGMTINAVIISNARGTEDGWELVDRPTLSVVTLVAPGSVETAYEEVIPV